MSQLNLFQFFKASSKSPQVALPSPNGPLSREIPSTAICEAKGMFYYSKSMMYGIYCQMNCVCSRVSFMSFF